MCTVLKKRASAERPPTGTIPATIADGEEDAETVVDHIRDDVSTQGETRECENRKNNE